MRTVPTPIDISVGCCIDGYAWNADGPALWKSATVACPCLFEIPFVLHVTRQMGDVLCRTLQLCIRSHALTVWADFCHCVKLTSFDIISSACFCVTSPCRLYIECIAYSSPSVVWAISSYLIFAPYAVLWAEWNSWFRNWARHTFIFNTLKGRQAVTIPYLFDRHHLILFFMSGNHTQPYSFFFSSFEFVLFILFIFTSLILMGTVNNTHKDWAFTVAIS